MQLVKCRCGKSYVTAVHGGMLTSAVSVAKTPKPARRRKRCVLSLPHIFKINPFLSWFIVQHQSVRNSEEPSGDQQSTADPETSTEGLSFSLPLPHCPQQDVAIIIIMTTRTIIMVLQNAWFSVLLNAVCHLQFALLFMTSIINLLNTDTYTSNDCYVRKRDVIEWSKFQSLCLSFVLTFILAQWHPYFPWYLVPSSLFVCSPLPCLGA